MWVCYNGDRSLKEGYMKAKSSVPRPLYNMARRLKVQIVMETIRRRNGRIEVEVVNFFPVPQPVKNAELYGE